MSQARVTFQGTPMNLVGPHLKVGDRAPDFRTLAQDLSEVTLGSSSGKVRLFSVVPSLDTPVCSTQTKRLADTLKGLPGDPRFYTVSADLPFAQKRWCEAEDVEVETLSDHRDVSFGKGYGVLIEGLRLLARSIFIVDSDDRIAYVQIVPEITHEPNYDEALAALKKVAG